MTHIEQIEIEQKIIVRLISDIANLTTIYHNHDNVMKEVDKMMDKWNEERVANFRLLEIFKESE